MCPPGPGKPEKSKLEQLHAKRGSNSAESGTHKLAKWQPSSMPPCMVSQKVKPIGIGHVSKLWLLINFDFSYKYPNSKFSLSNFFLLHVGCWNPSSSSSFYFPTPLKQASKLNSSRTDRSFLIPGVALEPGARYLRIDTLNSK